MDRFPNVETELVGDVYRQKLLGPVAQSLRDLKHRRGKTCKPLVLLSFSATVKGNGFDS